MKDLIIGIVLFLVFFATPISVKAQHTLTYNEEQKIKKDMSEFTKDLPLRVNSLGVITSMFYTNGVITKITKLIPNTIEASSFISHIKKNTEELKSYQKLLTKEASNGACTTKSLRYYLDKGITIEERYVLEDNSFAVKFSVKKSDCLNTYQVDNGDIAYKNKDFKKAKELYKKSCDTNNAIACRNLGFIYNNGLGTKQDYLKASKLYSKACDGGDAKGCFNLGTMYDIGQGVKQDYLKASKLYSKACDGGDAKGCFNLGSMYTSGQGISKSSSKAKDLFRKACDGGYANGCKNYNFLNKN